MERTLDEKINLNDLNHGRLDKRGSRVVLTPHTPRIMNDNRLGS